MKKHGSGIFRIFSLALLGFVCINMFVSNAQTDKENTARQGLLPIPRIIKKEGWAIPLTINQVPNKVGVKYIDGLVIETKALLPEERPIDFENYYSRSDNEIIISANRCLVRNFIAFESKGKRFAYQVIYNPLGKDYEKDGNLIAAVYNIFYVDKDGDGLFDERLQQTQFPPLPEWVKNYEARVNERTSILK